MDGRIKHVEAAGKAAEGRQQHPVRVAGEAAAGQVAAAGMQPRLGVEMARDLACLTGRRMAQHQAADRQLGHGSPAQAPAAPPGRGCP